MQSQENNAVVENTVENTVENAMENAMENNALFDWQQRLAASAWAQRKPAWAERQIVVNVPQLGTIVNGKLDAVFFGGLNEKDLSLIHIWHEYMAKCHAIPDEGQHDGGHDGDQDDPVFDMDALYVLLLEGNTDRVIDTIASVTGSDPQVKAFASLWKVLDKTCEAEHKLVLREPQYVLDCAWRACGKAEIWQRVALELSLIHIYLVAILHCGDGWFVRLTPRRNGIGHGGWLTPVHFVMRLDRGGIGCAIGNRIVVEFEREACTFNLLRRIRYIRCV